VKTFPIQDGPDVPYECAERAYATYAKFYGKSQSLERLGERGGFGHQEFACLFNGHRPYGCAEQKACRESADAVGRRLMELEGSLLRASQSLETYEKVMPAVYQDRDRLRKLLAALATNVREHPYLSVMGAVVYDRRLALLRDVEAYFTEVEQEKE
jgi:hypothetical protein